MIRKYRPIENYKRNMAFARVSQALFELQDRFFIVDKSCQDATKYLENFSLVLNKRTDGFANKGDNNVHLPSV